MLNVQNGISISSDTSVTSSANTTNTANGNDDTIVRSGNNGNIVYGVKTGTTVIASVSE
jgi:tetrahydromethanopterin S-methyltransferase subunit B